MKLTTLLVSMVLLIAADKAAAQNVETDRVSVSGAGILVPKPLERRTPKYPYAAFQRGTEGSVLLEFSVDADGHVVAPRVVDATPPGVFERAALDAVSAWSYQPLGIETKGMKVKLTFKRPRYARRTPTRPSSTFVREDPSPASAASSSLAKRFPDPALDPESP